MPTAETRKGGEGQLHEKEGRPRWRGCKVACLTDWALNKNETEGFMMLVEANLGDQTGEYVVAQNPDRFPPEAVAAARKRLVEHGVIPAEQGPNH